MSSLPPSPFGREKRQLMGLVAGLFKGEVEEETVLAVMEGARVRKEGRKEGGREGGREEGRKGMKERNTDSEPGKVAYLGPPSLPPSLPPSRPTPTGTTSCTVISTWASGTTRRGGKEKLWRRWRGRRRLRKRGRMMSCMPSHACTSSGV